MSTPPEYVLVLLFLFGAFVLGLLALLAALAWVSFWRSRLRVPEGFDELLETRTLDGATLVFGRVRAKGAASALPPVILCHGLAMNRFAMAHDPQRSLAAALAEDGRDCWIVELRGGAEGRHSPEVRGASFDTYLAYDVPTAIAYVCAATGAEEVDWVGFSMGGMLAYAHLGAARGQGVRRVVTVGSPVRFRGIGAERVAGAAPYVLTPFGLYFATPLGFLAAGIAPLVGTWLPRSVTRGYRSEHYDTPKLRRIFASSFSDVPAGVMKQFARWVREDSMTSNDGTVDYRDGLSQLTTPALVIAGDRDQVALPSCVREAYELMAGPEKRYLEVGASSGAHAHYDHLDLIMGVRAREEVFEEILRWLGKP